MILLVLQPTPRSPTSFAYSEIVERYELNRDEARTLLISVTQELKSLPCHPEDRSPYEEASVKASLEGKRSRQLPISWRGAGIPSLELESSLSIMILLFCTCPPERSKLRLVGLFLILSFHSLFRNKGSEEREEKEAERRDGIESRPPTLDFDCINSESRY